MKNRKAVFIFVVMFVLTLSYSWLATLVGGIFSLLVFSAQLRPNFLESLLVEKYFLWIALAWVSFGANSLWAARRMLRKRDAFAWREAAVCHLGWVLCCSFLHAGAFLSPFVMTVYVLKPR